MTAKAVLGTDQAVTLEVLRERVRGARVTLQALAGEGLDALLVDGHVDDVQGSWAGEYLFTMNHGFTVTLLIGDMVTMGGERYTLA